MNAIHAPWWVQQGHAIIMREEPNAITDNWQLTRAPFH